MAAKPKKDSPMNAPETPAGVTADAVVIVPLYRMTRIEGEDEDIPETSLDGGETWARTTMEALTEALTHTSDVQDPVPNEGEGSVPPLPDVAPNATGLELGSSSADSEPPSPPSATGAPSPAAVESLKAYAPDGTIYARSTDGGKRWRLTREGAEMEKVARQPKARGFTRRIAAVINEHSPVTDKRIGVPFSALAKANVLAGWADYHTLVTQEENALHGIVIPFALGMEEGHFAELRRVGPKLFLDVPAPMLLDEEGIACLMEALKYVDVVTVPTEILANKFRAYHQTVFAIPDMIDPAMWKHFSREPKIKLEHAAAHPAFNTHTEIVVAAPPAEVCGESLEYALEWMLASYGDRVRLERFDWTRIRPADEPKVYAEFDVVIVKGPPINSQVSNAPLLAPMMAGCGVIADLVFRLIRHQHNGMLVAHDSVHSWRDALRKMVGDSRSRTLMGRNARSEANRHSPEHHFNKLLLPYRLTLPEAAPITYDFPNS